MKRARQTERGILTEGDRKRQREKKEKYKQTDSQKGKMRENKRGTERECELKRRNDSVLNTTKGKDNERLKKKRIKIKT